MVFGGTVHFLRCPLTSRNISKLYGEIKPDIVIIVPIIIENIVKDSIFKYTKNRHIAPIYSIFKPVMDKLIKKRLISAFGGNFYQIIIGGAYLDKENENNQIQQEEQEAKYREQQASIQNQMKAPSIPNMPNMDSISRGFTMPTLPKF